MKLYTSEMYIKSITYCFYTVVFGVECIAPITVSQILLVILWLSVLRLDRPLWTFTVDTEGVRCPESNKPLILVIPSVTTNPICTISSSSVMVTTNPTWRKTRQMTRKHTHTHTHTRARARVQPFLNLIQGGQMPCSTSRHLSACAENVAHHSAVYRQYLCHTLFLFC